MPVSCTNTTTHSQFRFALVTIGILLIFAVPHGWTKEVLPRGLGACPDARVGVSDLRRGPPLLLPHGHRSGGYLWRCRRPLSGRLALDIFLVVFSLPYRVAVVVVVVVVMAVFFSCGGGVGSGFDGGGGDRVSILVWL